MTPLSSATVILFTLVAVFFGYSQAHAKEDFLLCGISEVFETNGFASESSDSTLIDFSRDEYLEKEFNGNMACTPWMTNISNRPWYQDYDPNFYPHSQIEILTTGFCNSETRRCKKNTVAKGQGHIIHLKQYMGLDLNENPVYQKINCAEYRQ